MGRDYNHLLLPGVRTIRKHLLIVSVIAVIAPTAHATEALHKHEAIDDAVAIDQVIVTAQRRPENLQRFAGNIALVSADELTRVRHQHLHEILSYMPGVWISRGSGQENLTAIRSPVLTGAGSCGAFLTLEDSIPTRPAGFCNVNQLFEINSEQARRIEVIRGPGNALYGSNALHGTINVLMPDPGDAIADIASLEIGSNDFIRINAAIPFAASSPFLAMAVYTDDGGFRDDTGYEQLKIKLKAQSAWLNGSMITALAISDLDQRTGGFITGVNAYKDPLLNRSNPNPEAFRDASSQRLATAWTRTRNDVDVAVRPYVRHSDMTFLQHFLPGQPLEENGHVSAGALLSLAFDMNRARVISGVDLEWAEAFLKETQSTPTSGSAFLQETRPVGKHYDFDVVAYSAAPYVHSEFHVNERLRLSAGLRLEYMHYRYDNRMLDGNTRDDGSACGFGGCLYTRPPDRSDDFFNVAPKVAANIAINSEISVYANLGRGFRAPQMTELYRLQSGQQTADLDSERIDSAEIGARLLRTRLRFEASLFTMRKRGSVYRDAEGFNVSNGRSKHDGVEAMVSWQMNNATRFEIDASYARHRYDFDQVALRGEAFVSGRDVDTAPRWLANAEVLVQPNDSLTVALQWAMIGPYYLDAENQFEYPGHRVANIIARVAAGDRLSLSARVRNLFDAQIADRADYAFGQYRYFPGRGREFFLELTYSAPGR